MQFCGPLLGWPFLASTVLRVHPRRSAWGYEQGRLQGDGLPERPFCLVPSGLSLATAAPWPPRPLLPFLGSQAVASPGCFCLPLCRPTDTSVWGLGSHPVWGHLAGASLTSQAIGSNSECFLLSRSQGPASCQHFCSSFVHLFGKHLVLPWAKYSPACLLPRACAGGHPGILWGIWLQEGVSSSGSSLWCTCPTPGKEAGWVNSAELEGPV